MPLVNLSRWKLLKNYMEMFESLLSSGSNNLDIMVKKVETVKHVVDMNSADAETIFNNWLQFPSPNSFQLTDDKKYIRNHGGSSGGYEIKLGGQVYSGGASSGFNQAYVDPDSEEAQVLDLSAWLAPHPGCGCGGGIIFRWNKDTDEAYFLATGNEHRNNIALYKIHNTSKYWGGSWDYVIGVMDLKPISHHGSTGKLLASTRGNGGTANYRVTMDASGLIEVYKEGTKVFEYLDTNPIEKGYCGVFATCTIGITDVLFIYEKTGVKTLGEAIQDVAWRDESIRFVVHATDTHPLEFDPENSNKQTDFEYTVAKLLAANCYLINLGTSINRSDMRTLIEAIQPATPLYTSLELTNLKNIASVASSLDIKDKGIYLNNYPISTAMNNSANYIKEIAKNFIKPSDWVLVGTQLTWDTEYKDGSMNNGKPAGEGDYALNYGEHNGKNIPSSKKQSHDNWDATHDPFGKQLPSTLSITNEFRGEKILAERWRYRHYYTYFDNPTIQESYHNQWIQDPEEVFNNPGKFRINYKRLDNPLYQLDNSSRRDTSLTHLFAEYRRWSDNYDKEGYNTTPNMIPIENKN